MNHHNYEVYDSYDQNERIGLGGFGSGLGFLPGLGFGRAGFGLGLGLPFFTGLAAGALLTPRIGYPYPPAPPIYPPYPYPPYPYPPYPYPPYPYR